MTAANASNANRIHGKLVDASAIADGKALTYVGSSDHIEYKTPGGASTVTISTTSPLTGGGTGSTFTLGVNVNTISIFDLSSGTGTQAGVVIVPGDGGQPEVKPYSQMVLATRNVATSSPLTGGGTLGADITLAISASTTLAAGSMSALDKIKLDGITGSGSVNNASDLTTGTLADARLTSNVPLKNGTNTFSSTNVFAGLTATTFTGNGAALTSLNGSNITTGTVADARLTSNIPLKNGTNTFSGANVFSPGTLATAGPIILQSATSSASTGTSYIGTKILNTYTQSGTAAATDLHIQRVNTSLGSGGQYMIYCQSDGNLIFRVDAGSTPVFARYGIQSANGGLNIQGGASSLSDKLTITGSNNTEVFRFTTTEIGDGSGAAIHILNSDHNRQLWLGDSSQAGDGSHASFRYIVGFDCPQIDGISNDGATHKNLIIGNQDSNTGIGFNVGATAQTDIAFCLHVATKLGVGSAANHNITPVMFGTLTDVDQTIDLLDNNGQGFFVFEGCYWMESRLSVYSPTDGSYAVFGFSEVVGVDSGNNANFYRGETVATLGNSGGFAGNVTVNIFTDGNQIHVQVTNGGDDCTCYCTWSTSSIIKAGPAI